MSLRHLPVVLCAGLTVQPVGHKVVHLQSLGKGITIDEYASSTTRDNTGQVFLLYGSGGLRSSGFPYVDEARLIARMGYRVYLPRYLDATEGRADEPVLHYGIWAQTVRNALRYVESRIGADRSRSVLIGYSLGGSVALSVAATEPRLAGVVVWSGSMPDAYHDAEVLPPLLILHGGHDSIIPVNDARQLAALCSMHGIPCQLKLYPNQGHVFGADAVTRANRQIEAFLRRVLSHS